MELDALAQWRPLLAPVLQSGSFAALAEKVDAAYQSGTVYPPQAQLFAAFALTPPQALRVVVLGQDPYHRRGQANGLAFSVCAGTPFPPSLRNIFTELQQDVGVAPPRSGDLTPWARQGVFLLNTVLSVQDGQANSHAALGWQAFTDAVVSAIAALPQPIVFWLWGAQAQKKRALAAQSPYPRRILCAPHPSPLSSYRGFFGSRPFSQTNAFLTENGMPPIDWSL